MILQNRCTASPQMVTLEQHLRALWPPQLHTANAPCYNIDSRARCQPHQDLMLERVLYCIIMCSPLKRHHAPVLLLVVKHEDWRMPIACNHDKSVVTGSLPKQARVAGLQPPIVHDGFRTSNFISVVVRRALQASSARSGVQPACKWQSAPPRVAIMLPDLKSRLLKVTTASTVRDTPLTSAVRRTGSAAHTAAGAPMFAARPAVPALY